MSAIIVPFPPPSGRSVAAAEDEAVLRAEIDRLDRLDRDLQVQAHRINLSIGEVRRQRSALLKRVSDSKSA